MFKFAILPQILKKVSCSNNYVFLTSICTVAHFKIYILNGKTEYVIYSLMKQGKFLIKILNAQ